MNLTLHYYDVYPKVFLINRETEITIRPLGQHVAFFGDYQLRILSAAQGKPGCYPCHENYVDMQVQTQQDGCIRFSHSFAQEGQYLVQIQRDGNWVVELPCTHSARIWKAGIPTGVTCISIPAVPMDSKHRLS